jgi:hypothetical protein
MTSGRLGYYTIKLKAGPADRAQVCNTTECGNPKTMQPTCMCVDDGRGPLDPRMTNLHARLGGVLGVLRAAEEDDLVRVGDHGDVDADAARAGSNPAVRA